VEIRNFKKFQIFMIGWRVETIGYRRDLSLQVRGLSALMSRVSGAAIRDGGR